MSKHSSPALTMRDALYEAPGPKMRAKIRIGTAISLVAVAALVALVLQRFYVTGQLSVHYWYFFTHLTQCNHCHNRSVFGSFFATKI